MKDIILIPAYEPTEELIKLLKTINKEFITIVVDDGSGTKFKKIFDTAKEYAHVISYDVNKGKGYALKTGLKYINDKYKDYYVITMDSDGQHKIKDALKLLDYAKKNKDTLVLGKRIRGKKVPLRSKIGNSITRFIYKLVTNVNVYDTQTGLRVFSSNLVPFLLNIKGDRFEYEMNILLACPKNNIPIKEIEIETIYINNNKGSHFNTFKDSYLVYKNILKSLFKLFIIFLIDYILFIGLYFIFNNILFSCLISKIISSSIYYKFNYKDKLSKYITLNIIIIVLNYLGLIYLTYRGINIFIAKILIEIVFMIINMLRKML